MRPTDKWDHRLHLCWLINLVPPFVDMKNIRFVCGDLSYYIVWIAVNKFFHYFLARFTTL